MTVDEFVEQARINQMPEREIKKIVKEYQEEVEKHEKGEGPKPFPLNAFLSVIYN